MESFTIMPYMLRFPLSIFSRVMAQSPPSCIAALMQTSRALYAEGAKHLLRDGVVIYPSTVESFARFMFAGGAMRRFAFLHKVTIDRSSEWSTCQAHLLTDVLGCDALILDTLVLRRAEKFLASHREVRTILCTKVTTLKHLVLEDAGSVARHTLKHLPSRLLSVAIIVPRKRSVTHWDLLSALRNSEQTLEAVSLGLTSESYALPCTLDIQQFPKVKSFRLGCCESSATLEILTLFGDTLLRVFPRLQHLQVDPTIIPFVEYDLGDRYILTLIHPVRQRNRVKQRCLQEESEAGPALLECSGELLCLRALGITHHVPCVRIWKQMGDLRFLPLLEQLLDDTRPTHLELSVAGLNMLRGVVSILRRLDSQLLRVVEVSFTPYHAGVEVGGKGRILKALYPVLAALPSELSGLDIVINSIADIDHSDLASFTDRLSRIRPSLTDLSIRRAAVYRPTWPDIEVEYRPMEWGADDY